MKYYKLLLLFITAMSLLLLFGCLPTGGGPASPSSASTSNRPENQTGSEELPSDNEIVTLEYLIDRSQLPPLTYQDLTLLINVGEVGSIMVAGDGTPIPFQYDRESGTLTVTTAASRLEVQLQNPGTLDNLGAFEKTPLRDNRQWAWSHGLDDNSNLNPSIEAFEEKEWRATFFLIGRDIDDTRQEEWILDAPQLRQLLAQGWSVGSHTWDHACAEPDITRETVLRGFNRVQEIVEKSSVPDYQVISFAAPCFAPEYKPILRELMAEEQITTLFNESGSHFRLLVDSDAVTYTVDARTALPITSVSSIGRDGLVGWDGTLAQEEMDWLAAHASEERHFWYNTVSHGGEEETLSSVLDYAYDNYGPGGTDELWVAPSDEIYSYLLVRDKSQVEFRQVR